VEYDQIRRIVRSGVYINSSDFVRDTVRRGSAEIESAAKPGSGKLKEELYRYMKERGGLVWPDDVARDLHRLHVDADIPSNLPQVAGSPIVAPVQNHDDERRLVDVVFSHHMLYSYNSSLEAYTWRWDADFVSAGTQRRKLLSAIL